MEYLHAGSKLKSSMLPEKKSRIGSLPHTIHLSGRIQVLHQVMLMFYVELSIVCCCCCFVAVTPYSLLMMIGKIENSTFALNLSKSTTASLFVFSICYHYKKEPFV
jgi:hypothetical protein